MDLTSLLTYGGFAIAFVFLVVAGRWAIKLHIRMEEARRLIWRAKQARRDNLKREKLGQAQASHLKRIVDGQIEEISAINEAQREVASRKLESANSSPSKSPGRDQLAKL